MAETRKKILAISGSLRSNSVNDLLLKYISVTFKDQLAIQVYEELALLPHFNPDLEQTGLPVVVERWRELVAAADGVLICTPEYVFSLPGALKNALEWTVPTTVFSDKPVALMVASGLGDKAFESLLLIMRTLGSKIGEHANLLVPGARSKFNAAGELTDAATMAAIQKLVTSFLDTIPQEIIRAEMAPAR
jgi:chromate reductase, NAD(P)H dehydrogenase (quinone)